MPKFILTWLSAIALFAATPDANAGFITTGNPATDGWDRIGNSLQNGSYIRGSGNFSFDVYRTTISPDATLLAATGWLATDLIIGIGGVIVNTPPAGWLTATTGADPNFYLDSDVRLVSKFGSENSWQASTTPPDMGNGAGSQSNGDGGQGSVQLDTNPNQLTVLNAGKFQVPDNGSQYRDTQAFSFSASELAEIGRYIYTLDASGKLASWEMVLNLTRLITLTDAIAGPTVDGRHNQALQGGGRSTDGLIPFEALPVPPAAAVATPLPPTLFAGLLAPLLLAGVRFRGFAC